MHTRHLQEAAPQRLLPDYPTLAERKVPGGKSVGQRFQGVSPM